MSHTQSSTKISTGEGAWDIHHGCSVRCDNSGNQRSKIHDGKGSNLSRLKGMSVTAGGSGSGSAKKRRKSVGKSSRERESGSDDDEEEEEEEEEEDEGELDEGEEEGEKQTAKNGGKGNSKSVGGGGVGSRGGGGGGGGNEGGKRVQSVKRKGVSGGTLDLCADSDGHDTGEKGR